MSYIEVEMNDKVLKLEYDRNSIVEMEKMGYNAIKPTEKIYTNFEIMVYGALLKHQPKTKWKDALEVVQFMEYGMMDTLQNLSEMINEVFILEGKKGKKLVRKGIKAA